MTTNPDLDQAREWAKSNLDKGHFAYGGRVMAAAHVIASLPDEWIEADKLREALDWRDRKPSGDDYDGEFYDRLRALLPTPQPRTLADMTPEEREACQWAQADFDNGIAERPIRVVITMIYPTAADILVPSGSVICIRHNDVTPLPDLPRMVWPGEQATEEDMSIIPPEIDTSTGHDDDVDMTPQDAPDGYYLVRWWGEEHPVPAEKVQGQWWVIGKPSMLPAKDVLIVSRLIPEGEKV